MVNYTKTPAFVKAIKPEMAEDYGWSLKSTMEDRGRLLLGISAEWMGTGVEDISLAWASELATDQVANLLLIMHQAGGEEAVEHVLEAARERLAQELSD